MTHRRFAILKLATLGLSLSFAGLALAQEKFPSRPVTIVVPQAAGGANDAIARVVAPVSYTHLTLPTIYSV